MSHVTEAISRIKHMNTPDTGWEKEVHTFVNELASQLTPSNDTMNAIRLIRNDLPDFIKYVRTSRDTYWKEREKEVLKSIIRVAKDPDAVDRIASLRLRELLDLDKGV